MRSNEYALITGTSSGLGYEMAQFLLEEGLTVIGISRRGTILDHPNFIDILCDIREEGAVEEMYELVAGHTDALHLIILNAGIFEMSPLVETSTKEFSDHFSTNVVGAFHILKHASDFLVEDETHIITVSSIASKKGLANISAYSASKFALNGMIESLREEWEHLNVRFSTLMPGAILTPIWDESEEDLPRDQMMSMSDFMHVFQMVANSPSHMQFPELVFLHKRGVLK
ncbi:MAG: SDR family NAD(P)-dependent oxidoreductase [Bacteriovorax sp.]|nr:SDR family NAD(P)-dependent oxidoreductase [Bacteriovorax sp.]